MSSGGIPEKNCRRLQWLRFWQPEQKLSSVLSEELLSVQCIKLGLRKLIGQSSKSSSFCCCSSFAVMSLAIRLKWWKSIMSGQLTHN